jgi:O-methyltransferase
LKKTVTGLIAREELRPVSVSGRGPGAAIKRWLLARLRTSDLSVVRPYTLDSRDREIGRDWPAHAETMIGLFRLDNLQACITDVHERKIPGDIVETGVWRGGAMIFARGLLEVLGDTERSVWCADSFEGLPAPDAARYPADRGIRLHELPQLAVPLEEVRANFERYDLLDERVRFLPGWFRDTLPSAPIERIAVLRLDGDLYESTIVALEALYPKVSTGGWVIIDDYALEACKQAVEDFRLDRGIDDELQRIDWTGVYWRRTS